MVKLVQVTRDNWLECLSLNVEKSQSKFVPLAAVSLAKVYIRPDGERVEYVPFAIYKDAKMVGFIMHAFEENTEDMYWINGFFIDSRYQGRGYGREALQEMMNYVISRFPQCKEIRLTVFPENHTACRLYERTGFKDTGEVWDGEKVMRFPVKR
ncbi:GNAT family N-acetyltransferase [Peribacillus kribbensis]|uniref:GNAT family N-acetyltransferase n=1 Tax=Peribacillus kribbensis TaxID=356658 RepID=UPI0003F77974|nr:GNAT family N-acetyltransferase [Peribacillus kribbensis]